MTMADAVSEVHEASDGRRWTMRVARPTDARALVRLFGSVRAEGRWLATPPSAVSEPSESYFVGEMIRSGDTLVLVAEADGGVASHRPSARTEAKRRTSARASVGRAMRSVHRRPSLASWTSLLTSAMVIAAPRSRQV